MSDAIIDRVDEMSSRIDGLEKSVQELMVQVRNGFTDRMKGLHWDATVFSSIGCPRVVLPKNYCTGKLEVVRKDGSRTHYPAFSIGLVKVISSVYKSPTDPAVSIARCKFSTVSWPTSQPFTRRT